MPIDRIKSKADPNKKHPGYSPERQDFARAMIKYLMEQLEWGNLTIVKETGYDFHDWYRCKYADRYPDGLINRLVLVCYEYGCHFVTSPTQRNFIRGKQPELK
jgi:hypothetical protein